MWTNDLASKRLACAPYVDDMRVLGMKGNQARCDFGISQRQSRRLPLMKQFVEDMKCSPRRCANPVCESLVRPGRAPLRRCCHGTFDEDETTCFIESAPTHGTGSVAATYAYVSRDFNLTADAIFSASDVASPATTTAVEDGLRHVFDECTERLRWAAVLFTCDEHHEDASTPNPVAWK